MANTRDQIPDYEERTVVWATSSPHPRCPSRTWRFSSICPSARWTSCGPQGQGPRCFRLGRRLYVRRVDLHDWLDTMAQSEAA